MRRTEALLNAINDFTDIEKQLDVLHTYQSGEVKSDISLNTCSLCSKEKGEARHGFVTCSCGAVLEIDIDHTADRMDPVDVKGRRWSLNKYKPKSYAENLLNQLQGQLLPVDKKYFRSLLQQEDSRKLINVVRLQLQKWNISSEAVSWVHVWDTLRYLKLGRFYKYTTYICESINRKYEAFFLNDSERERIIKLYTRFSEEWLRHRVEICTKRKVKRKSLPHVRSIIRFILLKLQLVRQAKFLPKMKSDKRQQLIDTIIDDVWQFMAVDVFSV